jgi:hypothetical protein
MEEAPLYVRTYDLLLWLIPMVQKFPRPHRFGLAERIQCLVLDFQDALVAAGKSKDVERRQWLKQADLLLAQLRTWMRLCVDLKLLTLRQYEHVSKLIAEVGRLLGAWIKKM